MDVSTLTLNNGVPMPRLGYGLFLTPPQDAAELVSEALRAGYRLIDTAAAYGNERGVGEAIRHSGLDRSEIFIETKVWISDFGYDETLHAFDKSATKLGVDPIDLLLLHQALPSHFDRTIDAYHALERLLDEGLVRAIGVSNFMAEHLDRLLAETSIVPAVNQLELPPYFHQAELRAKGEQLGIVSQGWSPIGGVINYEDTAFSSPLEDPVILDIADAHAKNPAQVVSRWHLQTGRSVIPKSTKPERIAQNFDVFDFKLTDVDITRIDALAASALRSCRQLSRATACGSSWRAAPSRPVQRGIDAARDLGSSNRPCRSRRQAAPRGQLVARWRRSCSRRL
ncbi:aldo/keto reductase [Georgenia subflava]|uniref:Aldo/keto reductase n=2 Tax=Georgenia subflava TaxID=1622177 RepID=A0A6N7EPG1_9MICO|nr:aldo/keto reductase [Georgenia subflava]